MNFTTQTYDLLVQYLAGGTIATDQVGALLLTSAYVFDRTHLATDLAPEVSATGYARFTGATLRHTTVGSEIHYNLSIPVTFGAFATSDWRYVVLFNTDTDFPYLCLDSGQANSLDGSTGFTLDPGTDPYLRLVPA